VKSLRAMLSLSACILGLAAALWAQPKGMSSIADADPQEAKAAVTGAVSDPSGNGVRGATVTMEGTTGPAHSVLTDDQGLYAITDLSPGPYTVTVIIQGNKVFQGKVVLSPGQVLTLSVAGQPVAQPSESAPASATETKKETASSTSPPATTAPPAVPNQNPAAQSSAAPQSTPPTSTAPPVAEPATTQAQPAIQVVPASAPQMPVLAAQATTTAVGSTCVGEGTIGGNVTDQSGAVLVGAEVKITASSSEAKSSISDDKGNYCFKDLKPGTYKLTVTMKGFKLFEAAGVTLTASQSVPLDALLEPAGETTEVQVTGQTAGQVETEKAEVSGTITETEVKTLQLNGRNFTQLIALTPGVSNQTGQDEAKVGVTGSVKYSVNGGRVEYNTFEVDGSDVLNAGLNGAESTLVVYPSLDAIQEVKVLTSNYGAMYGRTASGTVLVTTKSGGDNWHGDAYEFLRNEAFNARNYFDQTTKAPFYRRNDFGVTIGGPIRKNKDYIFGSEEFRIEKSPTDQQPDFNRGVPSLAERYGDFSDVCPLVNGGTSLFSRTQYPDCPSSGPSSVAGYVAGFPNNNIGQGDYLAQLDPNAVALLSTNLIPLPNSSSGCNSTIGSCYNAVISEPTHWREELVRFDHYFTQNIRSSLRFIHDAWDTVVPIPQWQNLPSNTVNSFPTVQNKFVGPGISAVATVSQTITPTLLNQITASFTNSHITLTNVNGPGGANYERPAALGEPGGTCQVLLHGALTCPMGTIFDNGFGGKAPGVVIGGNNAEYGGLGFTADTGFMPWEHTNPTYSFRDDVSKVIRKHTLQFGAQVIFSERNETNAAAGAATGDVQGLLTFSNVNGGAENTGNAFANFLTLFLSGAGVNAIQSYTQDSAQHRYYNRYQIGEPYLQDDWKVTPRLTVNLGVRFSLFGLFYEKYKNAYNWDPAAYSPSSASQVSVDPDSGLLLDTSTQSPIPINLAAPDPRILNGIVQCGENGVPSGCMKGHLFNPAPRVGLAWDPWGNGKTSIRAGYGMFYEHGTGEEANTGSLEASAPLVLNMTDRYPSSYQCIGGAGAPNSGCPVSAGAYPLNVTAIPTKAIWPYSQQWSFSMQRELPASLVATAAYVGSKGTHLTIERQLNQIQPVPAALNPFGLHEPLVPEPTQAGLGDCTLYSPGSFPLLNGTIVGPTNPAYTNLQAACAGENGGAIYGPSGGFIKTVPTPDVNTMRPYPGIGQIYELQNVANSDYNAFQATLRRTKGPLTIGGSYSYSHSIDNSSDRSDTTLVNSYDLRSNRASSNFDQRHLLSVSYIYKLPNLSVPFQSLTTGRTGDPTGDSQDSSAPNSASRLVRLISDGWEFSGITVFQSGTPFSVINGGSSNGISVLDNAGVANSVGGGSYPDLAVGSAPLPDARFNTRSFGPLLANPNLFVAPRGLTFGDAGRNFLNNPHRLNFDMSLLKHFPITEGSVLEFRAEAFNVFNHTQFRIFDPNLGNTGTNVISCYGGPNYSAGYMAPLDPVSGSSTGTDCVTGSAFLHPVDAHRPRTIQFGLKYLF
jgi:Carboxypeptidase regulatory-like domain/TonB-dependent Receptor Plug Domain